MRPHRLAARRLHAFAGRVGSVGKERRLKPFVGFNWNIGSLTTVNVIGFMVEP